MAKVSLSGPLKPREGRGCPVLLTWGARLSPHTSHCGRRAEEQWAEEGRLHRWPAGSSGRVSGRGGRMPLPKPNRKSFKRAGSG